jgi:hypothetical protein
VLAFYRSAGREVTLFRFQGETTGGYEHELPGEIQGGRTTGSGITVKQAIVILDDTTSLLESRHWVTIVRPFVVRMHQEGARFVYDDVREVTVIIQPRQ